MTDNQKRQNVRLSMPEDFALTKWLHSHEMKPGETIGDLAALARFDLKNTRINYNHVQARLTSFGIELIPAPEKDQVKRIDRLEKLLDLVVCALFEAHTAPGSNMKLPELLHAYIAERPGKLPFSK